MSMMSVLVNIRILTPDADTELVNEDWLISGGYATPHTAIDVVLAELRGLISKEMRRVEVQ